MSEMFLSFVLFIYYYLKILSKMKYQFSKKATLFETF